MKEVVFFLSSLLIVINLHAQLPRCYKTSVDSNEVFKKFLAENEGLSIYFHDGSGFVISERDLESWDWNQGLIRLNTNYAKEFKSIAYTPSHDRVLDVLGPVLFSICVDSIVITHVQSQEQKENGVEDFPFIAQEELMYGGNEIRLYPNNLEYSNEISTCDFEFKKMIEGGLSNQDSRVIGLELLKLRYDPCNGLRAAHLLMNDFFLKEYLKSQNLLTDFD